MKCLFAFAALAGSTLIAVHLSAQPHKLDTTGKKSNTAALNKASQKLYLDVHHIGPGKVTAKDVAGAHQKDLAVQKKYGVNFIKYWVDETKGDVYCLASSSNPESITKAHAEAHGLLPDHVYEVTPGQEEKIKGQNNLYLDLHELGPGKVNANAVAEAHKKDLAVQKKYGVNLINYWVDEKAGTVMCLAQAPDSTALINTHKEAHGLIPVKVSEVKQGQ